MEDKHIKPTPVVLVRPRHDKWWTIGGVLGKIVAGTAFTFLAALIAWWLGPIIFGDTYTLGYWQSFALIFFIRAILPIRTGIQYQDTNKLAQP